MRITIVTDVWRPQVNGVVTTLTELARGVAEAGHGLQVIEPGGFRRVAWPGRRDAEWDPLESTCRHASLSIL